jgi:hypothetical protein
VRQTEEQHVFLWLFFLIEVVVRSAKKMCTTTSNAIVLSYKFQNCSCCSEQKNQDEQQTSYLTLSGKRTLHLSNESPLLHPNKQSTDYSRKHRKLENNSLRTCQQRTGQHKNKQ